MSEKATWSESGIELLPRQQKLSTYTSVYFVVEKGIQLKRHLCAVPCGGWSLSTRQHRTTDYAKWEIELLPSHEGVTNTTQNAGAGSSKAIIYLIQSINNQPSNLQLITQPTTRSINQSVDVSPNVILFINQSTNQSTYDPTSVMTCAGSFLDWIPRYHLRRFIGAPMATAATPPPGPPAAAPNAAFGPLAPAWPAGRAAP